MKRIVLDMQCAMFADAISQAFERCDPDFCIQRAESPDTTAALCKSSLAYALIMEGSKRFAGKEGRSDRQLHLRLSLPCVSGRGAGYTLKKILLRRKS